MVITHAATAVTHAAITTSTHAARIAYVLNMYTSLITYTLLCDKHLLHMMAHSHCDNNHFTLLLKDHTDVVSLDLSDQSATPHSTAPPGSATSTPITSRVTRSGY